MNARAAAVTELETRLGYRFEDKALLDRALTHSSAGDGLRKIVHNERLEFLGDRVLGLCTAQTLMAQFPEAREGDLSQRYNMLVNRQACAQAARLMGLGPALRLAGGETKRGGREQDTILADACEAVLAAVYLDGGLEAARAAAAKKPIPVYSVVHRTGPDHAPVFIVEVQVEGLDAARAEGRSRQDAEKAAASLVLGREGLI
jgi:ribonuclease-3